MCHEKKNWTLANTSEHYATGRCRRCRRTMGPNQVVLRHPIIQFPSSSGVSELVNGRASGPVLPFWFLGVLNQCEAVEARVDHVGFRDPFSRYLEGYWNRQSGTWNDRWAHKEVKMHWCAEVRKAAQEAAQEDGHTRLSHFHVKALVKLKPLLLQKWNINDIPRTKKKGQGKWVEREMIWQIIHTLLKKKNLNKRKKRYKCGDNKKWIVKK